MSCNLRQFALENPAWIRFQSIAQNASNFHLPVWVNLLAEFYGFKPYAVGIVEEAVSEENILAGLPLMGVISRLTGRWVISLPFSDFCPPLSEVSDVFIYILSDWHNQQRIPQQLMY
jgi:hypothetical protein